MRLFAPSEGSAVRRFVAVAAGGVMALAALSLTAIGEATVASAAPSHAHQIRPAGALFSAAFPQTPREVASTPDAFLRFPGATSVSAYVVSSARDIFSVTGPVPKAPTYEVMAAEFPVVAAATQYFYRWATLPGITFGKIRGWDAYIFDGFELGPLNQAHDVRQPHAHESMLVTMVGADVYVATAITRSAGAARAFIRSLHPTLPQPAVARKGPIHLTQPSPGPSSTVWIVEIAGVVLLVLLFAFLIYRLTAAGRRDAPPTWGAAPMYGPPGSYSAPVGYPPATYSPDNPYAPPSAHPPPGMYPPPPN